MPHDDEAVLAAVGERLWAHRRRLGLTLAELGALTGLTTSTISRLETTRSRPTLEQLLPLARVYGVPIDELVAAPATGDPRVHLRPRRLHGLTFIPLGINQGALRAFKVVYPPASALPPPSLHAHPGREWLYVLDGEIRLMLGGTSTTLAAGEVAEFDTTVPHWIGTAHEERAAETLAIYGPQGARIHAGDLPDR